MDKKQIAIALTLAGVVLTTVAANAVAIKIILKDQKKNKLLDEYVIMHSELHDSQEYKDATEEEKAQMISDLVDRTILKDYPE